MNLTHAIAPPAMIWISAASALAALALLLWRCYGGGERAGSTAFAAACMTFSGLLVLRAAGAGIFGDAR
jgi:hypothetical protein